MRVEALAVRTSTQEVVSAHRSGLRSEGVAEITRITSGTGTAFEYGRTDGELVRMVYTQALGASRTRT